MRQFSFILILLVSMPVYSQPVNIIPQPVSVKQPRIAADFKLTSATQIVLEGSGLEKTAAFLNDYLQRFYLFKLKVVKNASGNNVIRLNYERMDNAIEGAYRMTVDNKGIYIAGDNTNGVFYGIQTLIQLLPVPIAKLKMRPANLKVAYISIEDAPRFQYRGLHLDIGRHFMPLDFIKKYIDYIALHKMNYFHWHLTEDQGWRIEIKKYPELTKKGAWRNGTIIGRYPGKGSDNIKYSGFYTQQQVKEIVKYAADRYVTVVPEIEMPGHSSAAIAAYPWLSCFPAKPTPIPANMISNKSIEEQKNGRIKLVQETWGVFDDVFCAGNDSTFLFLQNVIDEVITLFPSKYFHIGGDECPKTHWKICPKCQQRMKELNLKDEHELQSYFVQRIEKYLNSKGKTLIGWDEILEGGLAPKAIVMSWRGEEGGIAAAKENHEVIMTPGSHVYLDHSQSENEDSVTIGGFTTVEKIYSYEPIPAALNEEQGKYVLGAQGNVWTEYMKNTKKVEYMIFPRLSALSEVLWSPKTSRNWSDFEKRLRVQFKRYDLWNANYSKEYFALKSTLSPGNVYGQLMLTLKSNTRGYYLYGEAKGDLPGGFSGKPMLLPFVDSVTKNISETGNYVTWLYADSTGKSQPISISGIRIKFNKATGKKITLTNEASKNYPGDGAFTLVNGVINEKGLARSREFLGFSGTDCEAVIDLGKEETPKAIKVYVFEQQASWIYPPSSMEVFYSIDGTNFEPIKYADAPKEIPGEPVRHIEWGFYKPFNARYIKVQIKNYGAIPDGKPGAGNKAWLFVDEIEIR